MFDIIQAIYILAMILLITLGIMLIFVSFIFLRSGIEVDIAERIAREHQAHLKEPISDLRAAYRFADDLKCYAVAVNVYQEAKAEMIRTKRLVLPWPVADEPQASQEDVEWIWQAGDALSRIIEQLQEDKGND